MSKGNMPGLYERCTDACSAASNTECVNGTCVCRHHHPVKLQHSKACSRALLYGDRCDEDIQCRHYDNNTECNFDLDSYRQCICKPGYEMRHITGLHPPNICFAGIEMLKADMPSFLGMGLALSMFSAVLCLVLKIFARARYGRTRRFANANIAPPLTVSETYAAFALANSQGSLSPRSERLNRRSSSRRTSYASYKTGSRCPSMTSLRSADLVRTGSYTRAGSRRPSMSSLRSGSFAIVDPRGVLDRGDHYLVYIRTPARSHTSDLTSSSGDTPKVTTPHGGNRSTEQLFAVYHTLAERSPGGDNSRGSGSSPGCSGAGGSSKTSVFRLPSSGASDAHRSMSSEDVFLEEQEEEEEVETVAVKPQDCQVLIEEDEESEGETSVAAKLVK
ncbi:uncharacterized protein LOC125179346 [Hyalella azteca]|uniref:Uncharacterized protein LOC125179346 n=1 Tax=Hyalella azteca TaxID=294128 RepID=A0A979FX40_HYAAZ|nr:uncharacterized protein LOC125179346 [Hyalella azteca]